MTENKRKLAAIVFTDIKGFTELSSKNEPAALELLRKQRKLFKPIVEKNNGDWLKEIGDGLLLSFPTSIDAVNCSIAIQHSVKNIENLDLRIGVHQGEVIYQDGDIFGDDVNIASRLEKHSPVGGIAISGRVNSSLERNPDFETSFIGAPELSGVSQNIKIYCVVSHGLPKNKMVSNQSKKKTNRPQFLKKYLFPLTGGLLVLIGCVFWLLLPLLTLSFADVDENYDKRIAVLYFENRGSKEDAFFSDGLTEEIILRLSKLEQLSVVSRYDILQYKGKIIDLEEIKEKYDAEFLINGNINKLGEKIKIYTELVDLNDRTVKWSKSFEKQLNDIFAIQNEIALEIVNNIDIDLSVAEKELILDFDQPDLDVYDAINKIKYGIILDDTFSVKSNLIIIDDIIEIDPTFSDGYAMKGLLSIMILMERAKFWESFEDENKSMGLGKSKESKIFSDAKLNIEQALKYDASNEVALVMRAFLDVETWLDNTSNILNARKIVMRINEMREYYPDHYAIDHFKGGFENLKIILGLSSSDDKAINHFKSFIFKTKLIYSKEFLARLLFGNAIEDLISLIYQSKNKSYSDIIYYKDLMKQYYTWMYPEWDDGIRYSWYFDREKLSIGDWQSLIDASLDVKEISNKIFTKDKNPECQIVEFDTDFMIAYYYAEMGETEIALGMLEQIDTLKTLDLLRKIDNMTLYGEDGETGIQWWKNQAPYFYHLASKINLFAGNQEKYLEYNKRILKHFRNIEIGEDDTWRKLLKINIQTGLAKYFADKENIEEAKMYLDLIDVDDIPTFEPFDIHQFIDIHYNLLSVTKKLDDIDEYNEYLNNSYREIIKFSNSLNADHKEIFLNRYPVKEIMKIKEIG